MLLRQYTSLMGPFGRAPGQIDTLVLGCTHYVFAQQELRALLGPDVQLVSTGAPVARQARRLLEAAGLLNGGSAPRSSSARVQLFTTGDLEGLQAGAKRWLNVPGSHCLRAQIG